MPLRSARPQTARRPAVPLAAAVLAGALGLAACSPGAGSSAATDSAHLIVAVGAESQYASVISQIGGRYVRASAVQSNPNTDPHTFEASPSVAAAIGQAALVVQNGVGYDSYMGKIEAASPSSSRKVIDVQQLLKLPDSTPNPHLWYSPRTMPAVASAVAAGLSALQPAHRAYFQGRLRAFSRSLQPWLQAIAALKRDYPAAPVATTEPVGDDLLQAAGMQDLTPFSFQADIMNGVDPAPQDVALQNTFFSRHQVRVFVYNQQVTDSLTASFLALARRYQVPVVGVYETMPAGYTYQSWMLAETRALRAALAHGRSTQKL
jgi:zinc/manganese transport system substrate-binding protein